MLCRVFSRAKWPMYNKESTEKEKDNRLGRRKSVAMRLGSDGKKVARCREPRDGEEPPSRPTLDGEGALNTAWPGWWAAPYCNPVRSLAGTELGVTAAAMQGQHVSEHVRTTTAAHCRSLQLVRCGWMFPLFSIFLRILWKASIIAGVPVQRLFQSWGSAVLFLFFSFLFFPIN